MIKAISDHGKVTIELHGSLDELNADTLLIFHGIYDGLIEHDQDSGDAEKYKQFIIEHIEDAFKEADELTNKAAKELLKLLVHLVGSNDDED